MAERRARVVALGPPAWRLRLLDARCASCAIGCGGRCNVFATDEEGELELALASQDVPRDLQVGDRVTLSLDDARLRRSAWFAYGRVWLCMVLGAGGGYALGRALGAGVDALTLTGLVLGTSLAVFLSKHDLAAPRLARIPSNDNESM